MATIFLKAVGKVTAGLRIAHSFIPDNGKKVTLYDFVGKGEFSKNSYTAVIWKYGAADPNDEQFLAVEKGSGSKHEKDLPVITGDGTSTYAVVCANSEPTDDLMMDAFAIVEEV